MGNATSLVLTCYIVHNSIHGGKVLRCNGTSLYLLSALLIHNSINGNYKG